LGAPSRSTSGPIAVAAPRMMGPKSASTASSAAKVWMNVGEKTKSFEGTGGVGALVGSVPSGSSEPASTTNMKVHEGDSPAPPWVVWRGSLPPPRTSAKATEAARRLAAHPAQTDASRGRGVAGKPREELLLARQGRPSTQRDRHRPQSRGAAAGPSGSARPAGASRRIGSPRSRRASGRTSCSDAGSSPAS
jgi:hypothetical protein